MIKRIFFGLIGAFAIHTSYAVTLTINESGDTIGQTKQVTLKKGESLSTVAKRYGVAVREVIAANPSIATNKRLPAGTLVAIPIQYRLPSGPRSGIVLNLAELRIYYFHPDGSSVSTYPVAIGKQGWSTPQGSTTIVSKERNPAWRPPISIRREAARRGRMLPMVIPPGPRNPLGRHAMRLGIGGILIHGTTQPKSIGTRSSHGCIRMYAKDIEELFNLTPVGTDVRIVNEPKGYVAADKAGKAGKPSANNANNTQHDGNHTAHDASNAARDASDTVHDASNAAHDANNTAYDASNAARDASDTAHDVSKEQESNKEKLSTKEQEPKS